MTDELKDAIPENESKKNEDLEDSDGVKVGEVNVTGGNVAFADKYEKHSHVHNTKIILEETKNLFLDKSEKKIFSRRNLKPLDIKALTNNAISVFESDFHTIFNNQYGLKKPKSLYLFSTDDVSYCWYYCCHLAHFLSGTTDTSLYYFNSIDSETSFAFSNFIELCPNNSIVVMRDVLKRGNNEMQTWLEELDDLELNSWSEKLEQKEIRIIVFSEAYLLQKRIGKTPRSRKFSTINFPNEFEIRKFVDWIANDFCEVNSVQSKRRKEILEYLHINASLITRNHLIEDIHNNVLDICNHLISTSLNEEVNIHAIINVDSDVKKWFTKGLSKNRHLRIQSIVFAITQTSNESPGIDLSLYRWFLKILRDSVFKLKDKKSSETDLLDEIQILQSEVFKKCRIEQINDEESNSKTLQFIQSNYIDTIWDILVTDYDSILAKILEFLIELIDTNPIKDPNRKLLLGKVIGKLGLEFESEVKSALQRWSRDENQHLRTMVGYVMAGVLEVRNKVARESYLATLYRIASGGKESTSWTIVAASKVIGRFDMETSIDLINLVLHKTFDMDLGFNKELSKGMNRVLASFTNDQGSRKEKKKLLWHILTQFSEKQYRLLHSVSYSLTSLCITTGSDAVFKELDKLLGSSSEKYTSLKILYTIIFLNDSGICKELLKFAVSTDEDNSQNILIYQIGQNKESPPIYPSFLYSLYSNINLFPSKLRSDLRKTHRKFILELCLSEAESSGDRLVMPQILSNLFALSSDLKSDLQEHLGFTMNSEVESQQRFLNKLKLIEFLAS